MPPLIGFLFHFFIFTVSRLRLHFMTGKYKEWDIQYYKPQKRLTKWSQPLLNNGFAFKSDMSTVTVQPLAAAN